MLQRAVRRKRLLVLLSIALIGIGGLIFGIILLFKKAPAKQTVVGKSAFNTRLPPPDLSVKEKNKLEIYMEAAKDSARRKAEWEKDPNSKRFATLAGGRTALASARTVLTSGNDDPNAKKVNERLEKLYAVLNRGSKKPVTADANLGSSETQRLEKLLERSRTPDTIVDPNLARVEKVLDKVLEIQHPERVRVDTPHRQLTAYVVTTHGSAAIDHEAGDPVMKGDAGLDLTGGKGSGPNAFFGLEQEPEDGTENGPERSSSTIQAEVSENQTLQNGSTIKLRLLQDVYLAGHRIPANNFLYGTCTVNSERLHVQLTSAVCDNEIYPIALRVYDIDGLEGIFVPGAITRDVTKEGISQGVGGMSIGSLDPSLGAQAAAAGIETAKTLLSKKIRVVSVTVKAGHRVLLENPRVGR